MFIFFIFFFFFVELCLGSEKWRENEGEKGLGFLEEVREWEREWMLKVSFGEDRKRTIFAEFLLIRQIVFCRRDDRENYGNAPKDYCNSITSTIGGLKCRERERDYCGLWYEEIIIGHGSLGREKTSILISFLIKNVILTH